MAVVEAWPLVYVVPRDGRLQRVCIRSLDELRIVRTEMELLCRIGRIIISRGVCHEKSRPGVYGPADCRELQAILHDALDPAVENVIEVIDRDFSEIRKEIIMSAVNRDAEKLAEEALECAAGPGDVTGDAASGERATDVVEEALEAAQADLAQATDILKAMGADDASAGEPTAGPGSGDVTDSGEAVAMDGLEVGNGSAPEGTAAQHDAVAAVDCVPLADAGSFAFDEVGGSNISESVGDQVIGEAVDTGPAPLTESVGFDGGASDSVDGSPAVAPVSGGANAFEEIESGIRALGAMLSVEIGHQWHAAEKALEQAREAESKMKETLKKSMSILADMMRVRQAAEVARCDADLARQEARLFREDAERAKQRSEASARGAEMALDEAAREARELAQLSKDR